MAIVEALFATLLAMGSHVMTDQPLVNFWRPVGNTTGANKANLSALGRLQTMFGAPLTLLRGASTNLGGNHSYEGGHSDHDRGAAFDVSTAGMTDAQKLQLYSSAKQAGYNAFGFGPTILHIGMRTEPAAWSYYGGPRVGSATSYVHIGPGMRATWAGVPLLSLKNDTVANEGKPIYASLAHDIFGTTPRLPGPPIGENDTVSAARLAYQDAPNQGYPVGQAPYDVGNIDMGQDYPGPVPPAAISNEDTLRDPAWGGAGGRYPATTEVDPGPYDVGGLGINGVTPPISGVPPATGAAHPQTVSLKMGDIGQDVLNAQGKLASLGYYKGAWDGVYGPQTTRAAAMFQHEVHPLAGRPDGVVGPRTQAALNMVTGQDPIMGARPGDYNTGVDSRQAMNSAHPWDIGGIGMNANGFVSEPNVRPAFGGVGGTDVLSGANTGVAVQSSFTTPPGFQSWGKDFGKSPAGTLTGYDLSGADSYPGDEAGGGWGASPAGGGGYAPVGGTVTSAARTTTPPSQDTFSAGDIQPGIAAATRWATPDSLMMARGVAPYDQGETFGGHYVTPNYDQSEQDYMDNPPGMFSPTAIISGTSPVAAAVTGTPSSTGSTATTSSAPGFSSTSAYPGDNPDDYNTISPSYPNNAPAGR